MELIIFLSFKEGMRILSESGQEARFIDYYLKPYSQTFKHIYVFSWENEEWEFENENVTLVSRPRWIGKYLYNILLPFIHNDILKKGSLIRLMQVTSAVPAVISKILYSIPIIATYGFPYHEFLEVKGRIIKAVLWQIAEKLTFPHIDNFIVTYRKMRERLVSIGISSSRITILPNGVDTNVFVPLPQKEGGDDELQLLFVGRFSPEKNVLNLARAFAQLNNYTFHVTLIGTGILREGVQRLLHAAGVSVRFLDHLPHKELVKQYQSADIFMLPSVAEGNPKVLIEAMACGTACVVGDYPGHEDIVKDGENALVCHADAGDIAEKIEILLQNKELRTKLGVLAWKSVEEKNNIHTIIRREVDLLQSIAKC